jgi:hypothetical protein
MKESSTNPSINFAFLILTQNLLVPKMPGFSTFLAAARYFWRQIRHA